MATPVPPWLEGLEEGWEQSSSPRSRSTADNNTDVKSFRNSRIPRRSVGGLSSSVANRRQSSATVSRQPLAPLHNGTVRSLRPAVASLKHTSSRSVSAASSGSVVHTGTVQIQARSKSESPGKKQETLEWKKRLLRGQTTYTDQTDLFGPSALENIFNRSEPAENPAPSGKPRMSWQHSSDRPMPSSPPPWPLSRTRIISGDGESSEHDALRTVGEDDGSEGILPDSEVDASRVSEPFDLQCTTDEGEDLVSDEPDFESTSEKVKEQNVRSDSVEHRTISGPTELEQEDFSPVFVSKHTKLNGQIGYAAYNPMEAKAYTVLSNENREPPFGQDDPPQVAKTDADDLKGVPCDTDGAKIYSLALQPDLSLSENLDTGTPPVSGLSRHVQLKRGGYSAYGSFKNRPLSRSPSRASESSQQQNDCDPSHDSPLNPRHTARAPTPTITPSTPVQETTPEPSEAKTSGSPLKLFGPHDTFTNRRLLRRMSQLDPEIEARSSHSEDLACTDMNADIRNTSFGSGELDDHAFRAEIPAQSASSSSPPGSDRSPGSAVLVSGSRDPPGFNFESRSDASSNLQVKHKLFEHGAARLVASTKKSTRPSRSRARDASQHAVNLKFEYTTALDNGKRPPNSPAKDPTPKRRRTLHESEIEDIKEANQFSEANLSEALLGRKRKDSRHGGVQLLADPNTLAQRKILRPRNPTPNQDREKQVKEELREAAEEYAVQHHSQLEAVLEQIETSMSSDTTKTLQEQAEAVASEVAAFTLTVSRPSGEHGERKRSITTQDFLNEAVMVMNLIRAKARPKNGLRSVEESVEEGHQPELVDTHEPCSPEPLQISRPPSREDRPSGWRKSLQPPTNPRVISHLRKFEEMDDTDFIAESIASLHMATEEVWEDSVVVVDEHANIRITKPNISRETDSRPDSKRSQGSTLQSYRSDGTSTGRTIATTSTRKSDNVGTLGPDAVAHIIPNLVGTMMYDKEKQTWVRAKSPRRTDLLEPPSHLSSDEDPFKEISDLAVDQQAELRRISATNTAVVQGGSLSDTRKNLQRTEASDEHATSKAAEQRPVTRESSHARPDHSSSVPSRYSAFGSSQQEKVETRATSYNDEELTRVAMLGKPRQHPPKYAAVQAALATRTEQQTIPEEVDAQELDKSTVETPDAPASDEHDMLSESQDIDNEVDEQVPHDTPEKLQARPMKPVGPIPAAQTGHRRSSLRRQTLTNTINASGGREQSELSLVATLPGERLMNLSLSVSRPISKRPAQGQVQELDSSPCKGEQSFYLSDLPDFTVHEEDGERPSEQRLAARLAQQAADEVNDRYALAIKDLVKTLTDVKADEPYWEDVKQLDLQGRSLDSLYGLDDFCDRVQTMDVSNNCLRHLEGTPYSVRRLVARSNQLTSLTAWHHLSNLQFLDISGNKLKSLAGLGELFHLRELIADDNVITSLDGIAGLDALLTLRIRRNAIQQVDFASTQLQQLTHLDLCGNQIKSITSLESLSALEVLKLDDNLLNASFKARQPMSRVHQLSLRNCGLTALDVTYFSNLRTLLVDGNRLPGLPGLERLSHLDVLSIREQKLPKGVQVCIFDQGFEARTLRLSGNSISALRFSTSFLNLQHLELASTGLLELPDDFGLNVPNLRSLNLNFNFLKDIRPILNVQKIERLSLCGNRLSRLRKSVATLAKMATLTSLDMRDNPVTQGFYAPAITAQTSVVRRERPPHDGAALDEDQREETVELARHNLPLGDVEQDAAHRGRMDESTKLRRRVYELLLANNCRGLHALDGLGFDRMRAAQKDAVFHRLVELGIVRKAEA